MGNSPSSNTLADASITSTQTADSSNDDMVADFFGEPRPSGAYRVTPSDSDGKKRRPRRTKSMADKCPVIVEPSKNKRFNRRDKMKKAQSQRSINKSQLSMNARLEEIEEFCKMIKSDKDARQELACMVNPAERRRREALLTGSR